MFRHLYEKLSGKCLRKKYGTDVLRSIHRNVVLNEQEEL